MGLKPRKVPILAHSAAPVGLTGFFAVALVLGLAGGCRGHEERKLRRLDFSKPLAEAAKLFGVTPKGNGFWVHFHRRDRVAGVHITYPKGKGRWSFAIFGGRRASPAGAFGRFKSLAQKPLRRRYLRTKNGWLKVDSRTGDIYASQIPTAKLANTYWGVALYCAYGSHKPSAAQIATVNGK